MQTEFEFLRRLERDLNEVAGAEATRRSSSISSRPRRHWKGPTAAVASLLVLAFLIGLAMQGGSGMRSASFSSVGAAVNAPREAPDLWSAGSTGTATAIPSATPGVQKQPGEPGPAAPTADLSKIIRDGQVAVAIDDGSFGSRSAEVSHIAAVNGGSILSSSTSGGDSGSFTLRIPAANFDRAMVQLQRLGTVEASEVHGQDVTAEYVDLKAHKKIYLSRRKVLLGLMQQAVSIGETITLQDQLDDVQLKIDQIQGQLNFINKQVAESTIKVDLHEPDAAVEQTPGEIEKPSLGRAWDHAVQGFLNVLAAVVIGLGYVIPVGVVIAIGYAIAQLLKRRRATFD